MSTTEEPVNPAYGQSNPPATYYGQPQYPQAQYGAIAPGGYAQPMASAPPGAPAGPVGKVRSTWAVIGLSIVTFGLYGLYYYFATHEEMKRHSGEGVGGAIGLVLAIFTFGLVTPSLLPNEVGNLYAR